MTSSASLPEKPAAFARLHPKVQESLYGMRWTRLRTIQVDAIHEILNGDGDLIIAARTAAGKTENACWRNPPASCSSPRSIRSLFVNHPHELSTVFARLGFFVIDEMHSFLGNERGAHLRSLMTRLAAKSREPVRRIGLSATLGDTAAARRWLRAASPEQVRLLEDPEGKGIRLKLTGYLRPHKPTRASADRGEEDEKLGDDDPLLSDIFTAFHGKSAAIFANRGSKPAPTTPGAPRSDADCRTSSGSTTARSLGASEETEDAAPARAVRRPRFAQVPWSWGSTWGASSPSGRSVFPGR